MEKTAIGGVIGASIGAFALGTIMTLVILYFVSKKSGTSTEGRYSKHSEEESLDEKNSKEKLLNRTDD